ncbi:MAG: 1-(5-phosphoribosyl)-5-[(5-phosphoribosylamino)methylideneamino]imidazole-4-carboxamide isomerase [Thaumarchaeota archaeon]|nr:1-(5-phosphoribosyl)-5-[(5-phosphoribosylamino)methylideneamino]imidazole-4-carboxamide isomerase [Nitrososphaerota archaeon]
MKIIPAIDIMDNKVVRLVKGDPKNKTVYSSDPVGMAKKWEKSGADMLHVVDLDATLGLGSNLQTIKKIAESVSIPIEAAGGLRTRETIESALEFSSRVVLGTVAFKNKQILDEISVKYQKERIVISADQMEGKIVVSGWTESTGIELDQGLRNFINQGYFHFLITTVERDGTLNGPDLDTLTKSCKLPNTHVIASGGISSLHDITNVKKCGAFGVILGKALYDGKISVEEAKALA